MRPNFLPFPLRHILLLILLLGSAFQGVTQNPETKRANHWFFGFGQGLDFSGGEPVVDSNGIHRSIEAVTAISDTSGNLLFYGSHDSLYTRNHQFMPNGGLTNGLNPTQMVTVPQPGNDSLFYVFYGAQGGISNGIYAIVNMNMNGGNGAVVQKDVAYLQGTSQNPAIEQVAAVRHCNGEDVWIYDKRQESRDMKVWQLSSSGLDSANYVTSVNIGLKENGSGYFKFSPNGQFAAGTHLNFLDLSTCNDSIGIYRFDDCTGQFSDPVKIFWRGGYGLSFSPDNTKLYVGVRAECLWPGTVTPGKLVQYDLQPYNKDSILASKKVIASSPNTSFDGMQLAPDGRLYVRDADTTDDPYSGEHIGVVNYPNMEGVACDYRKDSVFVGKLSPYGGIGLPSFVSSYFDGLEAEPVDVKPYERMGGITVYPNPVRKGLHIKGLKGKEGRMTLFDPRGRIVRRQKISKNTNRVEFDMAGLSSGLYLLKGEFRNKKAFFNHKIIKP